MVFVNILVIFLNSFIFVFFDEFWKIICFDLLKNFGKGNDLFKKRGLKVRFNDWKLVVLLIFVFGDRVVLKVLEVFWKIFY